MKSGPETGTSDPDHCDRGRRRLLRGGLGLVAAAALPAPALAARTVGEKALSLHNLHTGETVRSVFWADGGFVPEGLVEIDHVLRDHRSGEEVRIDRDLLLLVHRLQAAVGGGPRIDIISGYRSPKTNALLRKASTGVAKKSYHTRGKAIDLRIPGVGLKRLHRAAVALKGGGVGYYPASGFIHVDTGPVRYWS